VWDVVERRAPQILWEAALAGSGGNGTGRPTSPSRAPSLPSGSGGPTSAASRECQQDFEAPLIGLKAEALVKCMPGSSLNVELIQQGEFVTVVCRIPASDEIVGSLAAFRGIRELIQCLEKGFEYVAKITALSPTQVDVHVRRRSP
jgi:hypothetical protein